VVHKIPPETVKMHKSIQEAKKLVLKWADSACGVCRISKQAIKQVVVSVRITQVDPKVNL
jgi:hypothetical protein